MSMELLFLNLPNTILEWILYFLLILAYSFLVIEGFRLENAERKFKGLKELRIIALIILIWYGVRVFVPFIETTNPTIFEISFVTFYTTTTYLVFQSGIFILILGIVFIIFGHKNHESFGVLILIAGIIYLMGCFLNTAFAVIINIYPLLQFISWIIRSLFLTSAIIILIYSILIKRLFFIIFSTLFLVAETISFLIFLGNL